MFARSSKTRLTKHDLGRFPDRTLFHRVARAVATAGCLPRKELYEAWEVARRVRRRFRGGRVVDLCGGHGLLGLILLLLDDTSPRALVVDPKLPRSAGKLSAALLTEWPQLEGRVTYVETSLDEIDLDRDDLVVSVHACGALTDRVIALATEAGARLAVMPCCHDLDTADNGGLAGWMSGPLAVDATRAAKIRARGWDVWTQTIPSDITPHNRLLIARPQPEDAPLKTPASNRLLRSPASARRA